MSVPRLPPLNCVWVLSKDTCKSWLVDFATNHSLISLRRRLHRFQTVHEIKSETSSGGQIYNSNQEWNILAPSLHWLNAEMTVSPPPSTKRNKQCIKEQGNGTIRLRKRNKWGDFIPKIIEGLNFTYAYNQYVHVNVLFVCPLMIINWIICYGSAGKFGKAIIDRGDALKNWRQIDFTTMENVPLKRRDYVIW